jgi:hypothetical protein
MTSREANVLWLKDIIEHLSANQQRLEWTDDSDTIRLLTDSMRRDLERCQRICEMLRQRACTGQTV